MTGVLNIYLTGVGGQGIGLLSAVLTQSFVAAGVPIVGTDTHGVAQRGGSVVSQLRVGDGLFGPMIPPRRADLVVALERLEAHRAAGRMLKPGGRLFYCDVVYQPIAVRVGAARYPGVAEVSGRVDDIGGTTVRVCVDNLPDPKLQNTALLKALVDAAVVPELTMARVLSALKRVLPEKAYDANRRLFETDEDVAYVTVVSKRTDILSESPLD